jgi:hypothetical protein
MGVNDVENLTVPLAIEHIYLDWLNNFLTIEAFADHYNLPSEHATALIGAGRWLMRHGM